MILLLRYLVTILLVSWAYVIITGSAIHDARFFRLIIVTLCAVAIIAIWKPTKDN